MKILILTISVFLLFSFVKSDPNLTSETYSFINAINLAKPGCESRCGDLIVPYPFGIGMNTNCSIGRGFDIHCNISLNPPKAYITKDDYSFIKQISDSTVRISNIVATNLSSRISSNYTDMPYTFSEVNKFTVIGCYDYAWLTSFTKSRTVSTGCMVFCSTPDDTLANECSGSGCCQSSIPKDISYYETQLSALVDPGVVAASMKSVNPGTYAFVGEQDVFKFNGASDLNDTFFIQRIEANVPIVLEWAIGNLSCDKAKVTDNYACRENSKCVDSTRDSGGYRCICKEGYHGNPYLSPGCQGTI
ncbi:EGF-like calcium-binding protein [Tanacetum coccineum]